MATDAAQLLEELLADPIALRRGPSVRDFGKKAERGLPATIKRFEALVKLRHPPSFAFVVETFMGHPSQMLGASLEGAMIASGERALLAPIARQLDAAMPAHHPVGLRSIAIAVLAVDPDPFAALASRFAFDPKTDERGYELARATLVTLDGSEVAVDPRWLETFHRALHATDDALVALAASLLGKARDRTATPRLLELLESEAIPIDVLAGALGEVGDEAIVPLLRAEAARRKSTERPAAKALEKLARDLERRGPFVPGARVLAAYGAGREVKSDDRFPLETLLVDGNVLVNGAMRCQVRLRGAGDLRLPTGAVAACDPLARPAVAHPVAFTHTLAPGRYPVTTSVLAFETEGDDVVSAATLRVTEHVVTRWIMADPATYSVASGYGAFVDASVIAQLAVIAEVAPARIENNRRGALEVDRLVGANLVSFPSGAGEGVYASWIGLDESGAIACITTSFDVVRTST